MEKMMGNPMEMMKQMMSGEPIAIEVQSVQVNTNIPDGIFSRSCGGPKLHNAHRPSGNPLQARPIEQGVPQSTLPTFSSSPWI